MKIFGVVVLVILILGGAYYLAKDKTTISEQIVPQQTQSDQVPVTKTSVSTKYLFPKVVTIPKTDNTTDVSIPSLTVVQNIETNYFYFGVVSPVETDQNTGAFKATRGSTISFLLLVNPKFTKGIELTDFDGKISRLTESDSTGYLWHVDYHVPERAYADNWEFYPVRFIPCTDSACKQVNIPNQQEVDIQITNPLDSKSQGTLTYTAHNILGTEGFSIDYPRELSYKEYYDDKHHLKNINFNDPLNSNDDFHSIITVIYDPDQYEKDHSSEVNETDAFEGGPDIKPDGSIWQSFHEGGGNNGTSVTFIRKGSLALEISENSYFGNGNGQMDLGPLYRSLFIYNDTLRFIQN